MYLNFVWSQSIFFLLKKKRKEKKQRLRLDKQPPPILLFSLVVSTLCNGSTLRASISVAGSPSTAEQAVKTLTSMQQAKEKNTYTVANLRVSWKGGESQELQPGQTSYVPSSYLVIQCSKSPTSLPNRKGNAGFVRASSDSKKSTMVLMSMLPLQERVFCWFLVCFWY